jgi:predicted transcriptional regulator
MEVHLSPTLESQLAQVAAERGTDAETLAKEAIERFLDYDAWFLREVDKGLAAADRGEFVEHDDVRKMSDSRYPPG